MVNRLEETFSKLHPKLQQRYLQQKPFSAEGGMTQITTSPAILRRCYAILTYNQLLFPEVGTNIPFTLSIEPQFYADRTEYIWTRQFYFPNATRTFMSTMVIDHLQQSVTDFLGSPALLATPLHLHATQEGDLMMRTRQQIALIGPFHVHAPQSLAANVVAHERYDEQLERFTIHVTISHPLLGTLMQYAGHYKQKDDTDA